ncbi:hypothetical protein Btru_056304 [Bulinus truncatus]|nr:hypothetical protein Btru_056304 [Bulinus truncatus]
MASQNLNILSIKCYKMSETEKMADSLNLSTWTLVNNQGEVMSGECDSESSDSSIEVVNFENGAFFSASYHCLRDHSSKNSGESNEAILDAKDSGEEEVITTDLNNIGSAELCLAGNVSSAQQNSEDTNTLAITEAYDVRLSEEEKSDELVASQLEECLVKQDSEIECTNKTEVSQENVTVKDVDDDGPSIGTEVQRSQIGACCLDLLLESSDNTGGPLAVEFDEQKLTSLTCTDHSKTDMVYSTDDYNMGLNVKTDSDSDSDFVRLERDDVNAPKNSMNSTMPARVSCTDSSICPNFSFLRHEGSQDLESSNRSSISPYEEDVDDDTESSTENGVDDRIESEQSEAGSFSAQNDIGDLSVFADIGDLPLDVGNVPRNYIHSPNNHLSTILNIIVLIAAILTMGISLGIIVGTDLEIEEWQHALEKQSMKIIFLEQQLKIKAQESSSHQRKIEMLQTQFKDIKMTARGFERAFDQLISDSHLKSSSNENGWLKLKEAIDDFISCDKSFQDSTHLSIEELLDMDACGLSIYMFLESYTITKNETITSNPNEQVQPMKMEVKQDITEKHSHRSTVTSKKETPVASVPFDVRDLQQSLTREQQRALRWQHLYLAERRQKERERENEEWEDERERESWENEKELLDQEECLKKLMAANLTRLTQTMAHLNISAFDDFANLSLLLSGVAKLKQSVIDSIQNVWENAEELFDDVQNKKPDWLNHKSFNSGLPDHQMLYMYVTEILNEINHWPDHDTLLEYLRKNVNGMRKLLENFFLSEPVSHILTSTDNIVKTFQTRFQQAIILDHTQDKNTVINSLIQLLYDLKNGLETEFAGIYYRDTEEEKPFQTMNEAPNSEQQDSNNEKKVISWPKRLGGLLKKTGASVREKVKNTWRKIKSVWHNKKTAWHKIKNLWHEKKPTVMNMAKGFTDHVISVSSKFRKLCTTLPNVIFGSNNPKVEIHNKCVYKARKQWQKDILHDPCKTLGKFSLECNTEKKQLKKNIKKINDDFYEILKLSNPNQVLKLKSGQANFVYKKFRSFLDRWASSKLLLKTDLEWIACQGNQWLNYINKVSKLNLKICNFIRLQDNLNEEHCGIKMTPLINKNECNQHKCDKESLIESYPDFSATEENKKHQNSADNSVPDLNDNKTLESDLNDTEAVDASSEWYLEMAKYRFQSRKEHNKADWIFDMAADREKQRVENESPPNWQFKKAEYRKLKRREERRNDWLFERKRHPHDCDSIGNCDADHSRDSSEKHPNSGEKVRRHRKESVRDDYYENNNHRFNFQRPLHHKYHSQSSRHDP